MTSHNSLSSEWTSWPVQRIMTAQVVTVNADLALEAAQRLMSVHSLRHVPVVEGASVVGIISTHDIAPSSLPSSARDDCVDAGATKHACSVRESMTPSPVTIHQHETITQAAERMLKYRISALPVIDDHGQLIGIVTQSDLLRTIAEDGRKLTFG